MDFSRLEKNICDVMKEEQIKLGYRKETVRLYYPLLSLNHYLNTNLNAEEMEVALKEFADAAADKFGAVEISHKKERFCFCLPPEASEYVHRTAGDAGFLRDFIETVSKHDITIEDVTAQFKKYSEHVHVEKAEHGEFDYLIYFEDGVPDDFRYCLTDEGCHMIYHRFTKEDYDDFHFEDM